MESKEPSYVLAVYRCARCLREFVVPGEAFDGKERISHHGKIGDENFRCGPLHLLNNPFPKPDIDYLDDDGD